MKALAVIAMSLLMVGCEARYRYECQDPDNQGLPQCQPEACAASKTCFNDLNGVTPWQDFSEKQIEDMCSSVDSSFE